jgi:hypothetical protein
VPGPLRDGISYASRWIAHHNSIAIPSHSSFDFGWCRAILEGCPTAITVPGGANAPDVMCTILVCGVPLRKERKTLLA